MAGGAVELPGGPDIAHCLSLREPRASSPGQCGTHRAAANAARAMGGQSPSRRATTTIAVTTFSQHTRRRFGWFAPPRQPNSGWLAPIPPAQSSQARAGPPEWRAKYMRLEPQGSRGLASTLHENSLGVITARYFPCEQAKMTMASRRRKAKQNCAMAPGPGHLLQGSG